MNRRFFVRKKQGFRVEEDMLREELSSNVGAKLSEVEIYNIYDVFYADEEDVKKIVDAVLSEPQTDDVFDNMPLGEDVVYLATEFLPGQYDQRADSAEQCIMLACNKENIRVKSGRLNVFYGEGIDLQTIKGFLINPVEMREKDLSQISLQEDSEIVPVPVLMGFCDKTEEELSKFLKEFGLAMTILDLLHVQNYFKDEGRDPFETEIRVLDTYWSDHCRHTTFETELVKVSVEEGLLKGKIEAAFQNYLNMRTELGRELKPVTLMDMATVAARKMRKDGKLDDMEVSEEINACSVEIDVDVDGVSERYLLMFKNETHNHPTEIEPFGGASTCIGGAIRDPLSGRAYVYQAMRITGAADITKPAKEALKNKLPQSVITKGAAHGYSSYGNQIGLATTYVKELYASGYAAKRMEVGAVVGAVPKKYVRRESPVAGDIVVLLGGATGRDGVGGATGSSKEHDSSSLDMCASEVQKGNAPMERRIQRLFRNPKCTALIKKSNDFGAGGVSVAIGELTRGIEIELDRVPTKYKGLSGTEIAISESQERMAVVIAKEDYKEFEKLCDEENLSCVEVATVTEKERLVVHFMGKTIVDISRDFLDTNGVRTDVKVSIVDNLSENPFKRDFAMTKEGILENLKDENVASQRGMVRMFDNSIGRTTVLMPYGGKYQASESEGSVQKIPVMGKTETVSAITYGFMPQIANKSTYLSAAYAVTESLARLVALGIDYKKARLSAQEYFERLGKDSEKWGKVTSALVSFVEAQMAFETPAIGGKDSMSGTFTTESGEQITVPPTLISFAVACGRTEDVISSEFKKAGSNLYLIKLSPNEDFTVNYNEARANFDFVLGETKNKNVLSASTIKMGGLSEALFKAAFGNKIGFEVNTKESLFDMSVGSILVETKAEISHKNAIFIGKTTTSENAVINSLSISLKEAREANEERYKNIFKAEVNLDKNEIKTELHDDKTEIFAEKKVQNPKVLIPVFFGTNCEYDTQNAWTEAGAKTEIFVLNNLSVEKLKQSIDSFAKKIDESDILTISGGFSAGDEPDGSGKFIANVLSNEKIATAIHALVERGGLVLGICNGFQALVKSGLLPYGKIGAVSESSPTLFRNDINCHVSRFANTIVTSNKSPWMKSFNVGDVYNIAFSHGEGKFVVDEAQAKELFDNGQVISQYATFDGAVTMNGEYNINGSSYAIEGITSKCGRILGKMGHNERYADGLMKNIDGNKEQNIFDNAVDYFRGQMR